MSGPRRVPRDLPAKRTPRPKVFGGAFVLFLRHLFCVIYCPGFTDDVYLDLAGVVQRFLDFLGNAVSQKDQSVVVDGVRLYHDAYLAARLNGEAALYALEPAGDLLQAFQALDIAFQILTARCAP